MRYLIAILTVSAFALMAATTQAQCPELDTLEAKYDCDLPVYGDSLEINAEECPGVDWTFCFSRTSNNTGRTKLCVSIDGTDVIICIDSDNYVIPGIYYLSGTGAVDENAAYVQSKMELDPTYDDCGHFANLKLIAVY